MLQCKKMLGEKVDTGDKEQLADELDKWLDSEEFLDSIGLHNEEVQMAFDEAMITGDGYMKIEFKEPDCNHSWKQYVGFTESYDYCEHCDERK